MLGRVSLLRGELDQATGQLAAAMELGERHHWLSFLPWPQALLGQVLISQGDLEAAGTCLRQAFARACQIGDPCWEGISARGLAMVTAASGDVDGALRRAPRRRRPDQPPADPYRWLEVYVLDALCELGRAREHPQTHTWVETMLDRASRTGMRELGVRALLHGAALGDLGDAEVAALDRRRHRQPPTVGPGGGRGRSDREDSTMNQEQVGPGTKGVTVELLATVDLGPEIPGMEGRQLRMRMVTMEPGGTSARGTTIGAGPGPSTSWRARSPTIATGSRPTTGRAWAGPRTATRSTGSRTGARFPLWRSRSTSYSRSRPPI